MSTRRPILIVSYYFPPCGGAGTQRFAKFARYLPDHGYDPIVVAADPETVTRAAPVRDDSLLAEVSGTTVCRVPVTAPAWISIRDRLRALGGFRTDMERWVAQAARIVVETARAHNVQAIVTTVSPYAVARLGPLVRRACDVPWLLDLRDPWALDGWRRYASHTHAVADFRTMRSALRGADAVIANTPAAARVYRERLGIDRARLCTIPNGFDPVDFDETPPLVRPPRERGLFRIVHAGTLHDPEPGRSRRHTSLRRIDRGTRSGRTLFEAVASLRELGPTFLEGVRLDLAGTVHPAHRNLAGHLGIGNLVREHGYLEHRDTLALLGDAQAVFVPLHDVPEGQETLIVPGKLYEAIASSRFVVAAVPEGDAARLIRLTEAGAVSAPGDSVALAETLHGLIEAWRGGETVNGADRSTLGCLTRPALTGRLAAAVGACIDGNALPEDDMWPTLADAGVSIGA